MQTAPSHKIRLESQLSSLGLVVFFYSAEEFFGPSLHENTKSEF
jgi:hypothetical protein